MISDKSLLKLNPWFVRRRMYELNIPTLTFLAKQAEIDSSTLSHAMGGGIFTTRTLSNLIRVLDCNPDELLLKTEPS